MVEASVWGAFLGGGRFSVVEASVWGAFLGSYIRARELYTREFGVRSHSRDSTLFVSLIFFREG